MDPFRHEIGLESFDFHYRNRPDAERAVHRFLRADGDLLRMLLLPAVVGFLATPFGKLLTALIVIAIVLILGRIVLSVAWKLLIIVAIVVALLFAATNVSF